MDLQHISVFTRLKAAVIATDSAGAITYWNPYAETLYGWQSQEVLGRDIMDLTDSARTYGDAIDPMAAVRAGLSWSGEFMVFCKKGDYLPALISLSPLFSEDGTPVGIIGISQDISGHKQTDDLLRKHQAELEKQVAERTAELANSNTSLRALSARLLKAQEDERSRIARELHDSTGQLMAALAMTLGRMQRESSDSNLGGFEECKEIVNTVITEIRNLSYLLHPPLIDELGLGPAVREYAQGFQKRSGIRVQVEFSSEVGRLSTEQEIAIFRIIQEALGNVHRHSGSPVAHIAILAHENKVVLEVRDRGTGLTADREHCSRGVGIQSMQERLRPLGGSLQLESSEFGLTVRAILPSETRLDLALMETI